MQRIKIKLPFKSESIKERRKELIEVAEILSNNKFFTIVEEKHYSIMSYIVIHVENIEVPNKEKDII